MADMVGIKMMIINRRTRANNELGRTIMVLLTLSLASVLWANPVAPGEEWAQSLFACKRAQDLPVVVLSRASTSGQTAVSGNTDGRIMQLSPEYRAKLAEAAKARASAAKLLIDEHVEEAHDQIWGFVRAHPDMAQMNVDLAIESSLLLGKWAEAYSALVPLLKTPGSASPELYVELSMASAGLGEVYPGQLEYVQAQLRLFYENQHPSCPFSGSLSSSQSPKNVLLTSALAMGLLNSIAETDYLDLCLRLDPRNVSAARQAIELFGYRGRYSDIRRVAADLAEKLDPGVDRDFFLASEVSVRGLKDRPQGAVVKP